MEKQFTGTDVTCTISTRGRYFTTLPLCLIAIANQTISPNYLIIFDDNEIKKDLREEPIYKNIFSLFQCKNINWSLIFGSGEGQVRNHQIALSGEKEKNTPIVSTPLIWRLDDDNIPEPNVLETLLSSFTDTTGAVSCLVLNSKHGLHSNSLASNKISDIFLGLNQQWFLPQSYETVSADHLYSTFLYRKEAGKHGYENGLSRIGHREETLFTFNMVRNGYECLINPNAIIWHFDSPSGGIRDGAAEMWANDEGIFRQRLSEWGIFINEFEFCVLDNGLGDHALFLTILPKIIEKNKGKKIIIAACYPEIFEDYLDKITLISIAEAQLIHGNLDRWNIYKWAIDHRLTGPLIAAFEDLYLKP